MALIKFGSLVVDARGSIGGITLARNRGGAYARARVAPLNPQSTRQTEVRSALASLSQRWATVLTDTQRAEWDLYAENVLLPNSLGEPRQVTGMNMYVRGNSLLGDAEEALVDDGPTVFTQGPTITPTLTLDAGADTVVITDLGDYDLADGSVSMIVQQGTPQNPGVSFFKGPFRRVGAATFVVTTDEPPSSAIPLAFPVVAGQAVFFRTATVTPDGRVGVPVVQRFLAS